jgi:hypothetical protein
LKAITALVGALLAFVQPAFAQPKDAAYYCITEMSAGLTFDKTIKRWATIEFRPDRKFVIRMKFIGWRNQKNDTGKDQGVSDYNIALIDAGTTFPNPCLNSSDQETVTIRDNVGEFRCRVNLTDVIVNLKTLRFLSMYPYGYVDSRDINEDNPYVSGGTCTKID